jgi:hypothetical protein
VDLSLIQGFFWVAIPAVCALWAARLWWQGIAARYPLLIAFLVGEVILDVSGYLVYRLFGAHSQFYVWFWPVSRVISSTLFFLVLLQVYQRLVDRYLGFQRLGQVALYVCLGGACAIVMGSIFLDGDTDLRTLPGFWIVEERGVYLALTAMALALFGFALFFRLVPPRNVLTLFTVFSLLFIGQTMVWSLRDFWGWNFRGSRVLFSSIVYFCCFLGGTLTFSRAGESEGYLAHHGMTAGGNQSGVARRLEEINQALLSVFRL